MPVTAVPVRALVAERTKRVLSACQYAPTAPDYARRVVSGLAAETDSEFAIWLNWPVSAEDPVACTSDCDRVLARLRTLCARAPVLLHDLDARLGITSIVAAPARFRSVPCGVLAVANAAAPYQPADLDLLEEVGRCAVADYESLERAEALDLTTPRQAFSTIAHDLRQPLGIIEMCACLLEMTLPASEIKPRHHLGELHDQVAAAAEILQRGMGAYTGRRLSSRFDAAVADEPVESRVLANSATSLVT